MVRQQNKRYPNGFTGQGGLDMSRLALDPNVAPPQPAQSIVVFDERPFLCPQHIQVVPYLEMAYRARRGDEAAALTLRTFGITLQDATKRPYWPEPEPASDAPEPPPAPPLEDRQPSEADPLASADACASGILLPPGTE